MRLQTTLSISHGNVEPHRQKLQVGARDSLGSVVDYGVDAA